MGGGDHKIVLDQGRLIQLEKISTDKKGVKELRSSPSRLQCVEELLIKCALFAVGLT